MANPLKDTWINYEWCAHELGLSIPAIMDDFRSCGEFTVNEAYIIAMMKVTQRQPKWIYPWGFESVRYILHAIRAVGDFVEIHQRMTERGFEIPKDSIEAIYRIPDEQVAIRNLMAQVGDYVDDPNFKLVCVRANALGYTLGEIHQEFNKYRQDAGHISTIGLEAIRDFLAEETTSQENLQEGRVWDNTPLNYVRNAFKIGLKMEHICHQLHTHGYEMTEQRVQDVRKTMEREAMEQANVKDSMGTEAMTQALMAHRAKLPMLSEEISYDVAILHSQGQPAGSVHQGMFFDVANPPGKGKFEGVSSYQGVAFDPVDIPAQSEPTRISPQVGPFSEWIPLGIEELPVVGSSAVMAPQVDLSSPGPVSAIADHKTWSDSADEN